MTSTENLALPLLLPSQSQKHVTHNEAILRLDALVQLSIKTHTQALPPETPAEGDRHVVPEDGQGAWAGRDGMIALYQDGGWEFLKPQMGFRAWSAESASLLVYGENGWRDALGAVGQLGINATADETNRLAVASNGSLFSHAGTNHRLNVNKAAPQDTASVVFQTGYSGRAEFGLAGSDDFSVKASSDGVNWREAMAIDGTSGRARFSAGMEHALSRQPLTGLIFTPGGDGVTSIWRADGARPASPRTAKIAAIESNFLTIADVPVSHFGRWTGYMEGAALLRIWNISRVPAEPAWIRGSSDDTRLEVADAAAIVGWEAGDSIRLGEPDDIAPVASLAIDPSPMMAAVLGAIFPQAAVLLKCSARGYGGYATIGVSGSGLPGSFLDTGSLSDGTLQTAMMTIPCSVPSPVSDANLLFIRESGELDVTLTSIMGVYA